MTIDQRYVLFSGCSFTTGDGWQDAIPGELSFYPAAPDSKYLWVNLCHKNIPELATLSLINTGVSGASNDIIFHNALDNLSKFSNKIKKVFCQWTATHRYRWSVGHELWPTTELFSPTPQFPDVNLNTGESYPRKYLEDIKSRFKTLHHIHHEIVKIVRYSSVVSGICRNLGIECYHINGICPWDRDYFVRNDSPHAIPSDYTEFTQTQILGVHNRSDQDCRALYAITHDDYQRAGGIDAGDWINLYDSFYSLQVDTNLDQKHPGIDSNQLYFRLVQQHLQKNTQPAVSEHKH